MRFNVECVQPTWKAREVFWFNLGTHDLRLRLHTRPLYKKYIKLLGKCFVNSDMQLLWVWNVAPNPCRPSWTEPFNPVSGIAFLNWVVLVYPAANVMDWGVWFWQLPELRHLIRGSSSKLVNLVWAALRTRMFNLRHLSWTEMSGPKWPSWTGGGGAYPELLSSPEPRCLIPAALRWAGDAGGTDLGLPASTPSGGDARRPRTGFYSNRGRPWPHRATLWCRWIEVPLDYVFTAGLGWPGAAVPAGGPAPRRRARPPRSVAHSVTACPDDRPDIVHTLIMHGEKYANVWNAKKLTAFVSESVCEGAGVLCVIYIRRWRVASLRPVSGSGPGQRCPGAVGGRAGPVAGDAVPVIHV